MKNILIIDNYDSFTYNLLHLVELFGVNVDVERNDSINIDDINNYQGIILSPGPGLPSESGKLMKVVEKFHSHIPIIGICLGMQAIGQFFHADLINMEEVQHGVKTKIFVNNDHFLFKGTPDTIEVGRYHSWAFEKGKLPSNLVEIASNSKYVMALSHRDYPVVGVQFHPESIMTNYGRNIIENWINNI